MSRAYRILDTTTAKEIQLSPVGEEYPTWLLWPAGRDQTSDRVARERAYHWQRVVVASRLLPVGTPSFVYDVGAGMGGFSVPLAKLRPKATIYAFEPLRPSFFQLCANLFLNGLSNVYPEHLALGSAPGLLPLYQPDAGDLASATLRPYVETAPTVATARVAKLDDLDSAGASVALIKIQVSGGEGAVIRGAAETIKRHEPAVLVEIWDPKKRGLVAERYRDEALQALTQVVGYGVEEIAPEFFLAGPPKRLKVLARRSRQ